MQRVKYCDIYDLVSDINSLGEGKTRGDVTNYLVVAAKIGALTHGYKCVKQLNGQSIVVDGHYEQCVFEAIEDIVGDKYSSLNINRINASPGEKEILQMVASNLLVGCYLIIDKYDVVLHAVTGVAYHNREASEESVSMLTESSKSYLANAKSKKK